MPKIRSEGLRITASEGTRVLAAAGSRRTYGDLHNAVSRLEEWIDGTVGAAHPPRWVTPQLPVPRQRAAAAHAIYVGDPRRTRDIVGSAFIAAATTAVTLALFVALSMALLPLPPRPSILP